MYQPVRDHLPCLLAHHLSSRKRYKRGVTRRQVGRRQCPQAMCRGRGWQPGGREQGGHSFSAAPLPDKGVRVQLPGGAYRWVVGGGRPGAGVGWGGDQYCGLRGGWNVHMAQAAAVHARHRERGAKVYGAGVQFQGECRASGSGGAQAAEGKSASAATLSLRGGSWGPSAPPGVFGQGKGSSEAAWRTRVSQQAHSDERRSELVASISQGVHQRRASAGRQARNAWAG